MRLYFIVYFEIVCFACKSSLSSLLTVQGYKFLVLWYHWCPTTPAVIITSNNHVNNKLCTMINNEIDRNAFINNVECDINHTNSLKHLLNNTEDNYNIPLSTYTDVDTLAEGMSAINSTLSILSLNEIHTVSVICWQPYKCVRKSS